MTFAPPLRRALAVGALVVAAALATGARRKPPPPPPPPPPPVSLSPRMIEQASAYRAYMARASAISPAFIDGPGVSQSVRVGAAYEPKQLLRGAVAYGAVVALQDPTFVAGVRTYALDPDQRRAIAQAVMRDPAYAVGFAGSAGAAGLVMNAFADDGRRLFEQGKAVKMAAYSVQRQTWSKAEVADRPGRLALAKQLSATESYGETAESARLTQAVSGGPLSPLGMTAQPVSPPYTPLVVRSLAVAALAALGYANDDSFEQVRALSAEPGSGSCLNMAKLNLYQCLAVSKPYYEDVFCLGQHALIDTGTCVMKAGGVSPPVEVKTEPAALRKARPTPVRRKAKAKARGRS